MDVQSSDRSLLVVHDKKKKTPMLVQNLCMPMELGTSAAPLEKLEAEKQGAGTLVLGKLEVEIAPLVVLVVLCSLPSETARLPALEGMALQ